MTLFLSEEDVESLLPMPEAIDLVEQGFRLIAAGEAFDQPRTRGGSRGAQLNVMFAIAPTVHAMAVKSYPVVRTDVPQASTSTLLVYDLPQGQLQGVLEADRLGQRRTGAATAVASKILGRQDSEILTVFGAGWQAVAQIEAINLVMPGLRQVLVVNRAKERGKQFASLVSELFGVAAEPTESEFAVRNADVIVTATGASEPLFDGQWLQPGTHINAVGSNYLEKREIDSLTVRRSTAIVVDSIETAQAECGDLDIDGFAWDNVAELGDVLSGEKAGRVHDTDITLFESHGLAMQDLMCGVHVIAKALANGRGFHFSA